MPTPTAKAYQVLHSPLVVKTHILFAPGHLNLPLEPRELSKPITVEYPPGEVIELYEKHAIIQGRTENFFVDHQGVMHTHDEVRWRLNTDRFREVA